MDEQATKTDIHQDGTPDGTRITSVSNDVASDIVNDPTPPSHSDEDNRKDDHNEEGESEQTLTITKEQLEAMKIAVVENAKKYARAGKKTRKEPSPSLANDLGPYDWWERQDSYEGDTWSISFWDYDNKTWHIQASRIELQQDGRSKMTAYSLRDDHDVSFPGFQVYKEQSDNRYHMAAIEDIVYLDRVLKGLVHQAAQA